MRLAPKADLFRSRNRFRRDDAPARSIAVLIAAGVLFGALIAAATVLLVNDLHGKAVRETEHHLGSLATVLADQADRALQAIDLVQQAMIEETAAAGVLNPAEFTERMSTRAVHEGLKNRIAVLPQVNAATLVNVQGKLVNFSRYWPIPDINLADRDWFQAFMADPTRERFVSHPTPSRGDGVWTMYLVRKLSAPDGTVLGFALGAVELEYFEQLYKTIAPEPDYVLSMFRTDGILAVRYPSRPGSLGRVFTTAGAPRLVATGAPVGVIRNTSPIDGRDRLVAMRTLAHFPLVMSVSRTADAALAQWRQQATVLGSAAALLETGLVCLLVLGVRQERNHARLTQVEAARSAAEERERGERDLRNQYARFGTALDHMTLGLCMFDQYDRLIVMNERYASMYDLPPDLRRPGTPLHLITRSMAAIGDPAVALCGLHAEPTADPATFTLDLADGRIVSVIRAPIPDGGWVWTHEDVSERKRNEARIAHMAHHDSLTGLANRVRLRDRMEEVLARLRRGAGRSAILCLDLDGFKGVNDTLGHPAGDVLLYQVARRLESAARDVDLVARLGGDEFAIVQADVSHPAEVAALAERIVTLIRSPFEVHDQQIEIGTSIGVVMAEDVATTPDELLRSADIALYRAKAAGRNTWRFFAPEMDAELQHRRAMEADLKRAFAEQQFELHYQPLVEAVSNRLTGFEALLRWRHPQRGMVRPDEFIPLAEETGLIRSIGGWILMQACRDAQAWPDHVKVAVNLSPVQFTFGTLVRDVEHALAGGLPPARLEIEITESVLLRDNETTLAILRQLHLLGVSISMDDFGTGYSSLNYLRSFPFDKIKLDQSFVRTIGQDRGSLEIVRAVIGLGKALGMKVLAEGVETTAQRDLLRDEGYDELQGYLFSRPVPAGDVPALIARFRSATAEQPAL